MLFCFLCLCFLLEVWVLPVNMCFMKLSTLAALSLRSVPPNKRPNLKSTLWKVDSAIVYRHHGYFQWLKAQLDTHCGCISASVNIMQSEILPNLSVRERWRKLTLERRLWRWKGSTQRSLLELNERGWNTDALMPVWIPHVCDSVCVTMI